jgi:hypothetical protein
VTRIKEHIARIANIEHQAIGQWPLMQVTPPQPRSCQGMAD